ncbi:hypothetical protein NBRC110019_22870 [Neptunitalea chrysea]|uniref:Uncharacterized protein n=1 Tax=Neptunitalea chrysea TaxID=1647581 RepID=A0A9W6B861_9FLAO|nr:hypothetical protein NBRC110019_22870 [Neptunitalea chrysea]
MSGNKENTVSDNKKAPLKASNSLRLLEFLGCTIITKPNPTKTDIMGKR